MAVEKKPPQIELRPGIPGLWFITRVNGRTHYQGVVHAIVPSRQGDLVLVQYCEWFMGELNTMALVPLAGMTDQNKENEYVLFEDNEHLKYYMENVQRYRDERIDREKKEKADE